MPCSKRFESILLARKRPSLDLHPHPRSRLTRREQTHGRGTDLVFTPRYGRARQAEFAALRRRKFESGTKSLTGTHHVVPTGVLAAHSRKEVVLHLSRDKALVISKGYLPQKLRSDLATALWVKKREGGLQGAKIEYQTVGIFGDGRR